MPDDAATEGVPRLVRPLVWLVAVALLPARAVGRTFGWFLTACVRCGDAAGRAALRAGRAVGRTLLRVLGPLGRLVRRILTPPLRLLIRAWDRAGLWLLLRLFRPMGRLARRLAHELRPAVDRVIVWGRTVVRWTEPVTRALLAWAVAVDRATGRLADRLRRVWAPVARAGRSLMTGRATRDG